MSKEFSLPDSKRAAIRKDPSNLIIFSKPKVGKSELVAGLDNNLILDLEKGTEFIEAMSLPVESIQDIKNIGEAIKQKNYPYKFITVDTITALEDLCIPYAEIIYSQTLPGKNWFTDGKVKYKSIINMPDGAGYKYLREAFENIINYIKTLAPNIILLGHIKDVALEKEGGIVNSTELDLTGKLKRIASSKSDAIGYLYRGKAGNILSFKTKDEVACGARPEHLSNQEILISEKVDGKLVTHWDKIYIDKI